MVIPKYLVVLGISVWYISTISIPWTGWHVRRNSSVSSSWRILDQDRYGVPPSGYLSDALTAHFQTIRSPTLHYVPLIVYIGEQRLRQNESNWKS